MREEMQPQTVCVCVSACVCGSPSQDFRSHLIALHANETSQTCTQGQGSVQLSTGRKATLSKTLGSWYLKVHSCGMCGSN